MQNFVTTLKQLIAILAVICLVSACAGRTANPIMISQYGDNKKSCKALEVEINNIWSEIQILIPETDKTPANIVLGVAGAFFFVPWIFIDLSQAEQMEVNALRQRYNHLLVIATDKECEVDKKSTADSTKSSQ